MTDRSRTEPVMKGHWVLGVSISLS